MRFVSFSSILSSLLFASLTHAESQENLFMVPEIEVSIPTAALGQNPFAQAVKKGQQEAYLKLLKKIIPNDEQAKITPLSDTDIGKLVSKVDVEKQQKTKACYKASLNYYFSPVAVQELLSQKGMKIQEPNAKKILIIPILKTNATDVKLWEESNSWRQIWANYPYKDKIKFPFVVPYGDFEDMGIVSAQEALEGNKELLQKIAQKYNCEDCIVALASIDESANKEKPQLSVSTHYYGENPYSNLTVTLADVPRNGLYQAGFKQLIDKMDENWRPKAPEMPLPEKDLEMRIALFGPADYDLMEVELKKIPFIKSITLLSMTTEEAFVKLHFQENDAKLQEELLKLNLNLEMRDGKFELSWKKNFTPSLG